MTVIRSDRARAAMRLVHEVHELGACTEAGRRHLVDGLLRLLGCALGGVVHDIGYGLGMTRGIAQATLGGFDRDIMAVFDTHDSRGSDYNPFHAAIMRRGYRPGAEHDILTWSDRELVPRDVWEGSEWINEYARPARVDQFLCSVRLLAPNVGMGCGFMRGARDRPFDDEDREVLHLVNLGVGRFFELVPPPKLTPRMRATLEVLVTGASDKEIAVRLGLSTHTVRQYVKAIFRAYGVSGRAQLIATAARGTRAAAPSGSG